MNKYKSKYLYIYKLICGVVGGPYLYPVPVPVHLLLQALQGLQQPVGGRQVAATVLIGQLCLHGADALLHVVKGTLELERLNTTRMRVCVSSGVCVCVLRCVW